MVSRLIGIGPLVGLSLFAVLPALAEDTPRAGDNAPAVAAPEIAAPDTAPAEVEAITQSDVDAGADVGEPPPAAEDVPPDSDQTPLVESEMKPPMPEPSEPEGPMDEAPAPEEMAPATIDPAAFLDDAYVTCVSALENTEGAYDIFDAAEWWPQVDEGSQTAYYRQISGDKWIEGIGDASLFYSVEVFPSVTIGYCMISVDNADETIPVANLLDNRDLTGSVRRDGDRVTSIWENADGEPNLFVQADENEYSNSFVLDATMTTRTPATELPPLDALE